MASARALERSRVKQNGCPSDPRTWEPAVLLEEYRAFPEGHESNSTYTYQRVKSDVQRVLVAQTARRTAWHVVDQIHWSCVLPACADSVERRSSFQGNVQWGEPTCKACRRRLQWDGSYGPGRRSEWRCRQRNALEGLLGEASVSPRSTSASS